MKKEHTFAFVAGLFILAYVLDAVVNPLNLSLASPYHFFQGKYISQYPFTTTSIIIKTLGLFITPLWLMSFIDKNYTLKGVILLVLGALMQLYALQDIVTGAGTVPIEWSLAISLSGAILIVPMAAFFLRGLFTSVHESLVEPQEISK